MGSVRKRPYQSGRWEARWYGPDGKQHSKTFSSPSAARRYIKIKEGERETGEYVDHRLSRTPFGQLADEWLEKGLKRETRAKTKVGYETILRTLRQTELWDRPIGRIDRVEIEDLLNALNVAPGTKRNIFRVISIVMKRAVGKKMIHANPCEHVSLPKLDSADRHFLTEEQVQQLAEAIGSPHDRLIRFAVATGLRAGEISGLQVKHLDALHGLIKVEQAVSDVNGRLIIGKPKSKKSRRTVGLARTFIEQLIDGKEPEDFVFGAQNGHPRRQNNWMGRHFRPAVERLVKSGIWPRELLGLHFHDLRHTCASLMIKKGIHIKLVSEWLGHSTIALTADRYGHIYKDQAATITEAMSSVLVPAGNGKVVQLPAAQ